MKKTIPDGKLLAAAGIAVLAVLGAGAYAVHASGTRDRATTNVPSGDRVEDLLRDESKTPEQRIEAALAAIEEKRRSDKANDDAPPAGSWASLADPAMPDAFFSDNWDPFAEMERMREASRSLFANMDRQLGMMGYQGMLSPPSASPLWKPSGDFAENADAYVYTFDLPGVGDANVSVTTKDDSLVVEGRRESKTEEAPNANGRVLRREVVTGSFKRIVALPPDVDRDRVEARMDDGVLTVTLPKKAASEKPRERSIPVK